MPSLRCESSHVVSRAKRAELLVILRFRQLVKVSSIAFKAPSDKGPTSVKARGTHCGDLWAIALSPAVSRRRLPDDPSG